MEEKGLWDRMVWRLVSCLWRVVVWERWERMVLPGKGRVIPAGVNLWVIQRG